MESVPRPGRDLAGGSLPDMPSSDEKEGNGPPILDPNESSNPALSTDEYTLPLAFKNDDENGYRTAAIGKWHLADKDNGWLSHPNISGFDHHSGLMSGFPEGYYSWIQVTNGEAEATTGYTPNRKIDDAVEWINDRAGKPWFLWLAFNLPHDPLHLPEKALLQESHADLDPKSQPELNGRPYFEAMMEAMDTEIGRLTAAIKPEVLENTYIIFLGDNGTSRNVIDSPFSFEHAKGSLYQGGINTPLIISGPGVTKGSRSSALVNSVDLFSTIIEMGEMKVREKVPADVELDSMSLMPYLVDPEKESIRKFAFADRFGGQGDDRVGDFTIRNGTHKLISFENGAREELYNLENDPYEHDNLLENKLSRRDQAQYQLLVKQSSALQQ